MKQLHAMISLGSLHRIPPDGIYDKIKHYASPSEASRSKGYQIGSGDYAKKDFDKLCIVAIPSYVKRIAPQGFMSMFEPQRSASSYHVSDDATGLGCRHLLDNNRSTKAYAIEENAYTDDGGKPSVTWNGYVIDNKLFGRARSMDHNTCFGTLIYIGTIAVGTMAYVMDPQPPCSPSLDYRRLALCSKLPEPVHNNVNQIYLSHDIHVCRCKKVESTLCQYNNYPERRAPMYGLSRRRPPCGDKLLQRALAPAVQTGARESYRRPTRAFTLPHRHLM